MLKIMTWNIKGEASMGWNNQYEIKKELVDKILDQQADIIVLTAFVVVKGIDHLFERFQNEGYIWFQQNRTGKNGILIGIKRSLVNEKEIINQVYHRNIVSSVVEDCNILRVTIPMACGKNLCIIGCRMETGGEKDLQAQYDSERKYFDNILIPHIYPTKPEDLYIVCGDFNNARCCGDLNEKFDLQDYAGKAQCNYNLNIIKDTFDSIGFTMVDIGENGESIATHKGYFPLDHIFIYGLQSKSFGTVCSDKLSDHDILWSEVELNQVED